MPQNTHLTNQIEDSTSCLLPVEETDVNQTDLSSDETAIPPYEGVFLLSSFLGVVLIALIWQTLT